MLTELPCQQCTPTTEHGKPVNELYSTLVLSLISGASGGGVNVAKTLDLLKAVLQSSFNMEVKRSDITNNYYCLCTLFIALPTTATL